MKNKKIPPHLLQKNGVASILSSIALFGGLDDTELSHLLCRLEILSYAEGDTIFSEGDEPTYIYIVRSGRVKIIVNMETEPYELAEFSSGQCFGETALIGIQPHTASALAVEPTELIVLTGEALRRIFKEEKALFGKLILNIAREACRRLHKADETMLHYVQMQNQQIQKKRF
jgi:CRP/FNR family transcriptional regulator, cyclic AMP receptor protein